MRTPLVLAAFVFPVIVACAGHAASIPEPSCSDPAPLHGSFDPRAPSYLIGLHDGVNIQSEADRLALRYGFSPTWVFTTISVFVASFDDDVREILRCESSVEYIEYDAIGEID